jgi:hypothetical protein
MSSQPGPTGPEGSENPDPFAPENVGAIAYITQARIYDVLVAILMELNEDAANNLLEIHSHGAVVGPSPSFVGNFITDELNTEPVGFDATAPDDE